ncbi:hypothetical protein AB0K18_41495 [Nonomuraea sp. NPDC049421]|uniref:hypothetical protein n=1 Tax=Nonomuraea sp. NPDC049421 TaxID=3155275 RepID=UPI0034197938
MDSLIDDLYYLAGAPPYPKLMLPPMPSAVLIVNLGDPFRIGTADYGDGCVLTTPTHAVEFGLVRHTSGVMAAAMGRVTIGDLPTSSAHSPDSHPPGTSR